MLTVKTQTLVLEVLETELHVTFVLGEGLSLCTGKLELDLEGLLGLVLTCAEDVLVTELLLTYFKSLLVDISLPIIDPLPCFRFS